MARTAAQIAATRRMQEANRKEGIPVRTAAPAQSRPESRRPTGKPTGSHLNKFDPTDRIPPMVKIPEGAEEVIVSVTPTERGFDGWTIRERGVPFNLSTYIKDDGEPDMPPWCTKTEDYVEEEIDLPATNIRGPGIRGGASPLTGL